MSLISLEDLAAKQVAENLLNEQIINPKLYSNIRRLVFFIVFSYLESNYFLYAVGKKSRHYTTAEKFTINNILPQLKSYKIGFKHRYIFLWFNERKKPILIMGYLLPLVFRNLQNHIEQKQNKGKYLELKTITYNHQQNQNLL